jgi:hypothetical protein
MASTEPNTLVDLRFVIAFLIGPALGALVYSALLGVAEQEFATFASRMAVVGFYGYMVAAIMFLPALIILRWLRVDYLALVALLGLAGGILFDWAISGPAGQPSEIGTLVNDGALPFTLIAVAIRLIAGPRAA